MEYRTISFKDIILGGSSEWNKLVIDVIADLNGYDTYYDSKTLYNTIIKTLLISDGAIELKLHGYLDKIKTTDMENLLFDECLKKIIIVGANIDSSVFDAAIIEDCLFYKCTISNSDFTESELNRVHFIKCDITNTKFSDTRIDRSRIINSNIINSDFTGAIINCTVFDYVVMSRSEMRNVDIQESYIHGTKIDHTYFDDSEFRRCMIMSSTVKDSSFKKAVFLGVKTIDSEFIECSLKESVSQCSILASPGLEDMKAINMPDVPNILNYVKEKGDEDEDEDKDGGK